MKITEHIQLPKCTISKNSLVFEENITYEEWQKIGSTLQKVNGAIQWWIGDWLNYGERKWGEMYAQAIEETGLDYSTLSNYKAVSEKVQFPVRKGNLSWSAHKEVAYIPQEKQIEILGKAENEHLHSRDVKALVRDIKRSQPLALPEGKYQVLYADPPWSYNDKQDTYMLGGATKHYPTMSIEELCALPIQSIVDTNAVLFLWVTSPLLEECFAIIKAWGFEYKTSFVWDKVKHNMGHYNSVRHELLLICTKGSYTPQVKQLFDSVVMVERSEKHSEKPQEFRTIIETIYPSSNKIELFAREQHEGWKTYGNE